MKKLPAGTPSIGMMIAAAAAVLPNPATAQVAGWNGRYVWEEDVGRHGGTTPSDSVVAFITYTLSIGPGNGPTGCLLTGQGFQTNRRIQCTVTPRGNAITVKFYKFGADNVGGRYPSGQPLFTLTRTPRGIVTSLNGLGASSRTTPHRGMLFRRAG
ncbi:DUF5991 domain-containing protein [Sphingomonas sp. HF-S4]|uniref:DUF5991 domain-containing protein n=1 Tax=Sphingomonas agrestis TaxID=3080540 RepID=A0ABU3Y9I3_9SPHN|nr:DUF5991 domain-containing protein [Sphingomonas sp. HF-S4]MDV3458055.1 DUF5991 domain-containing protein [Sphingomonas sp. HF-S4]